MVHVTKRECASLSKIQVMKIHCISIQYFQYKYGMWWSVFLLLEYDELAVCDNIRVVSAWWGCSCIDFFHVLGEVDKLYHNRPCFPMLLIHQSYLSINCIPFKVILCMPFLQYFNRWTLNWKTCVSCRVDGTVASKFLQHIKIIRMLIKRRRKEWDKH